MWGEEYIRVGADVKKRGQPSHCGSRLTNSGQQGCRQCSHKLSRPPRSRAYVLLDGKAQLETHDLLCAVFFVTLFSIGSYWASGRGPCLGSSHVTAERTDFLNCSSLVSVVRAASAEVSFCFLEFEWEFDLSAA